LKRNQPLKDMLGHDALDYCIGAGAMTFRATEKSVRPKVSTEVPLDETGVEFDENKIDRIVNDVRDEVHVNARGATQGKYESGAG
jgi:hypothetical protein